MDEFRGGLLSKDGPERPSNRESSSNITFWRAEGVCNAGGFEEEECEENKNFGTNARPVEECIDTEGLEAGDDDKNRGPTVVEREGQMDKQFIAQVLSAVVLLHNVINMTDSGADEERKYECDNKVPTGPDIDIDRVENKKEWEAPCNTINDSPLSFGRELVYDISE